MKDIGDYYKPRLVMQRLQSDLDAALGTDALTVEDASFTVRTHPGVGDHLVLEAEVVGPSGSPRTVNGTSGESEEDAYQELLGKCVAMAKESKL